MSFHYSLTQVSSLCYAESKRLNRCRWERGQEGGCCGQLGPMELGRGCFYCALRTFQHKGAATQLIGEDKRQVFMRQTPSLSEMKDKNLSSYVLFYRWEVSEGKKNYQSF